MIACVDETTAVTVDDPDWRLAMHAKMSENKHRLYRDTACITALEDFLEQAARETA